MVIVVVQRQADSGIQREGVGYICAKCQGRLLDHEFSSANDTADKAPLPGFVPPLETLIEGGKAAVELNTVKGRLTCNKCGHENQPFPIDVWGWETYHHCYDATEEARALYFDYIADMKEPH